MNLRPLRIPANWKIDYNMFLERLVCPTSEDDEYILDYSEDLLQLSKGNLIIDIGWYPEFNVDGHYRLVLIENGAWDNPTKVFETKSSNECIKKLEHLLINADTIINQKGSTDLYHGSWYCAVTKTELNDTDCYEVWAAGNKCLKKSALFVKVDYDDWSYICYRCVYNPENRK